MFTAMNKIVSHYLNVSAAVAIRQPYPRQSLFRHTLMKQAGKFIRIEDITERRSTDFLHLLAPYESITLLFSGEIIHAQFNLVTVRIVIIERCREPDSS